MIKQKRLDGKKKLVSLTVQMEKDLRTFCRDNRIESENELIRAAIAAYIYSDHKDETLKLQGIEELRKHLEELHDMVELSFKYARLTHISQLAYHPEIESDLADAAFKSANLRHEKFYTAFQESLRSDPPFFERLLHKYYSGT